MTGIYGISYTQFDRKWQTDHMGVKSSVKFNSSGSAQNQFLDKYSSDMANGLAEEKEKQARHMRELIRSLNQTSKENTNPYTTSSEDMTNGLFDITDSSEKEDDEKDVKYNYNSREVATRIQRAKTSLSAGQAVLSAKRKVLEVKRKISAGKGDPEELQLALTHARRMEMVARKKKNHLELEEMVQTVQKRDENLDKREEMVNDLKSAAVNLGEEKIYKAEDEIFEERAKQISEALEYIRESNAQISEEALADINEMISEFGEEELKELEEAMEMLENMEVVDPHMSKEDLEKLKRKHRAAEQKAMVKADMDYLKGMIKLQNSTQTVKPVQTNTSTVSAGAVSMPQMTAATGITPSVSISEGATIDIQV